MVNVKILCDDRFDKDLTYQIDDEIVTNHSADPCEKCPKYADCQGWAKVFNRCGGNHE